MRHLKDRSLWLVLAGVSATLWGCGDDLVIPEDANPKSITIVQGATQTGTAGQVLPVPLVVQITDDVGRPVAQQPLTITLDDGGSITPSQPVSNSDGRAQFTWTLGPAAGDQQISVATGTSGPNVVFHGSAAPATANVATAVGGNAQSGQAGTALNDSLVIQVTDEFDNPVSDAVVTWTTGSGTMSPSTTTTNSGGVARSRWTLGDDAGPQQAFATVAGIADPVSFTATATAGPTPALAIDRQPSVAARSGEVLARQPRIQLQSAAGQDLATAGVAITAALSGATGNVTGTTTTITDSHGRAEFVDLAITAPTGNYVMVFTATGYTSITSGTIAVVNRVTSPSNSTLTAAPGTLSAGGTSTITATIKDQDGAPISGVTVIFATTGSGQTLQQPGVPTDANGVATGSITATVSGPRTITAMAGNVAIQQTAVVQVDPGPSSAATTDAQVPAGQLLTLTTITIRSRDQFGNARTVGGEADRFVIKVTGSNTVTPAIKDEGDGTYTATYLVLLPGGDSVAITLDGVPIKGSPYPS